MKNDFFMVPSADQDACMVVLSGQTGQLKAANELRKSTPTMEPHADSWGALLSACKPNCDFELREVDTRRSVSTFVLLSNI